MKVTVVGTGYVGLVTGACLSEMGNHVLCLDVDPAKIKILEDGGIPIHEPGLLEVVRRNVAGGRLEFTTNIERAVAHGTIQFIAVGTPPDEDGSADLQYVTAAARNIGRLMTDYKVIVDKSTVPVGTADKVKAMAFVERLFRTAKYRPQFPSTGFASVDAARDWARQFVHSYNHNHRHCGICCLSLVQHHAGQHKTILSNRDKSCLQARARHPARWSGKTRSGDHTAVVALNPERHTPGQWLRQ